MQSDEIASMIPSSSDHSSGDPVDNHVESKAPPEAACGMIVAGLAEIHEKTILDEAKLAAIIGVTTRTVRRMVSRHELPPPTRFAGRSAWLSGRILAHFEARAEKAADDATRRANATQRLLGER